MGPRYLVTIAALVLLACSDSQSVTLPGDPRSEDYKWESAGGQSGYISHAWRDSSYYRITLNHEPVSGARVRYRVTAGTLTASEDTTDETGQTLHVWRIPTDGPISGEIFGCVEASDGCTELRLSGFNYTPPTD